MQNNKTREYFDCKIPLAPTKVHQQDYREIYFSPSLRSFNSLTHFSKKA